MNEHIEKIELIAEIYAIAIILIILCGILIIIIKGIREELKNKPQTQNKIQKENNIKQEIPKPKEIPIQKEIKQINCIYQKRKLLTYNEYNFYLKLKEITKKYNLEILTKIRLADLIEIKHIPMSKFEWGQAFNKIKSKHIDFAIADNMNIMILIELDDNSHNRIDRIQRDKFVDDTLEACDYKIIHTRGNTEEIEKQVNDIMKIF